MTVTPAHAGTSLPSGTVRPLCFGVVVWGAVFRRYFVDYLLTSLLADGNLPEDIGRHKALFVCCPEEDWQFISAALAARQFGRFIEVEWIDFSPDRSRPIPSMSRAHSICFRRAYDRSAYLSMLSPDAIYSSGFVRYLEGAIRKGRGLVLCPAFRVEEFAFFSRIGLPAPSHTEGDSLHSIACSAAELIGATIASLHSEILTSNVDAPYLNTFPNNFHICAADDSWFVSKNLSWAPVLIDLMRCDPGLLDSVADSVIDSQILAQMIPSNTPDKDLDFVMGCEAIALASWAPESWSARPLKPRLFQKFRWSKRLYNDLVARITLRRYMLDEQGMLTDWIKVRGLKSCVTYSLAGADQQSIHAATYRLDLDLSRTCGDLLEGKPRSWYQRVLDRLRIVLRLIDLQARYTEMTRSYLEVILAALFNSGDARQRVLRRLSRLLALSAKGG